ncbi:3'-5' exonuclease [Vibrio sp. RC27]
MAWTTYFHPLRKLHRARQKARDNETIPDFLSANINWDCPHLDEDAKDLEYICLDLETTGLDPNHDTIVSIGWVVIKNYHIDLSSSVQMLVKDSAKVSKESIVIHHLTPEMLSNGYTLDDAMEAFFTQAQGRVIVAHACFVEQGFLDRYINHKFGLPSLPMVWLDTLGLEKRLCQSINKDSNYDLRLSSIREKYGLPEYNAHGALIDSISSAELLLAQIKRVFGNRKHCFGRLYRISHGH